MSSVEVIQVLLNRVEEAMKAQDDRIDDIEKEYDKRIGELEKKDHERDIAQVEENVQLKIVWSCSVSILTTLIGLLVWWLQTHGGKQP